MTSQTTYSLTPTDTVNLLLDRAETLIATSPGRVMLGLAGGPGTGKSTIAAELVAKFNADHQDRAALLPMDGFHRRHAELERLGTVAAKGAPHTFDAQGFVGLLSAVKQAAGDVAAPSYDRSIEDVVPDAFTIPGTARLIVVEGNYLLLGGDWAPVRELLDLSVFLGIPRELARARLMKRHAEHGLFTEERNRAHIERTDLPNFDLVAASRPVADIAIDLLTDL